MKVKYLLFVLALVPMGVFATEGDNRIVTSQAYVEHELSQKQGLLGGGTAGTVLVNSGEAGTVNSKGVYHTGTAYSNQTGSLVEAQTANTAIQNGLNQHVTCEQGTNASDCTLWRINTLNGTYLPQ